MKIGIEAQRIFRSKKHGMDIYALQLIRYLQQIDHDNEYFIFVAKGPDRCLAETSNFHTVEVMGITYADWEQVFLPLKIKQLGIELMHYTGNTAPIWNIAPFVLTIHDIIYLNQSFAGGSMYQRLGHYYRKWVVPQAFAAAKRIFTVSNFEKKTIEDHFGLDKTIQVTYNGLNPIFSEKQGSDDQAIAEKLGLPDKYMLFLGNTAPKKNMPRVLEAYAKYVSRVNDPVPLVIVETSESKVRSILAEIGAAEVIKHCHCIGYVANDWLPVVYRRSSLFLYPSLRESFGIPIIEAMACGAPVVTANTSSMPEIAGDAAILVDPYNMDEIAEAIGSLHSYPEKLAENACKAAKRLPRFTWQSTANDTLQAYTLN